MHCYVLAGGRSTRMGVPKAALEFAGSTFLDRIVSAAAAAFDEVVAVVRPHEPRLRAASLPSLRSINEPEHDDEGAIFGLARALADAPDRCFVVAVDYPLVTVDLLRLLRRRFESSRSPMLVPVHHGVPQTLCAGYAPEMRARVEAKLAARDYALRPLATDGEPFPWDGPELMNVNTPAELEEARSAYGQQGLLSSR